MTDTATIPRPLTARECDKALAGLIARRTALYEQFDLAFDTDNREALDKLAGHCGWLCVQIATLRRQRERVK